MGMGRSFHGYVEVEASMRQLRDADKNSVQLFEGTRADAFSALVAAQKAGKKYHAGCENEDVEGRCAGHEVEVRV